MNARSRESAFALAAPADWTKGPGWVVVFALRWLGSGRRISAPDSLAVVSVGDDGQVVLLKADEAMGLLSAEADPGRTVVGPAAGLLVEAKRAAQELLRETMAAKRLGARVSPAISTLLVARIQPG